MNGSLFLFLLYYCTLVHYAIQPPLSMNGCNYVIDVLITIILYCCLRTDDCKGIYLMIDLKHYASCWSCIHCIQQKTHKNCCLLLCFQEAKVCRKARYQGKSLSHRLASLPYPFSFLFLFTSFSQTFQKHTTSPTPQKKPNQNNNTKSALIKRFYPPSPQDAIPWVVEFKALKRCLGP